jgi:hypothetical protein
LSQIENIFRASLSTQGTKCALIVLKGDFRKSAITFDDNVSFTNLKTGGTTSTHIGEFDIITHPRRPYRIIFTPAKEAATAVINTLSHVAPRVVNAVKRWYLEG